LVTTLVLLFEELGSLVEDETDDAAVMFDAATDGARFTATIMSADAPETSEGSEQLTDVVVTQVQPAGAETETKVVLAGIASVKVTAEAVAGPLLVMVWV
jgi:hypothetical protein